MCGCVCQYVCVRVSLSVSLSICTSPSVSLCVNLPVCLFVFVRTHAHTHTRARVRASAHTHAYTPTDACTPACWQLDNAVTCLFYKSYPVEFVSVYIGELSGHKATGSINIRTRTDKQINKYVYKQINMSIYSRRPFFRQS